MTFQESSNFDCATFAKNWNWRIGKNRIGNRGNARAFLLVEVEIRKFLQIGPPCQEEFVLLTQM